jgi:hypothetical protein
LHDAFEQPETVRTGPLRISVGKVITEIAEGGGAEQGIGDGVSHHVCIAVTGKALGAFELDTAKHEAAIRIVGEGVDIEPHAHADGHGRRR